MRFARNREGRGRNYVVVEGAEGFKRLSGENLSGKFREPRDVNLVEEGLLRVWKMQR